MIPIKISSQLLFLLCVLLIISCNPVSEHINKPQWNSLWNSQHDALPFQSDFYHGANYRTPQGSCDDMQCHGANLTGGNSWAPSCYSCHSDKWTVFQTTHTLNLSERYHHVDVDSGYDKTSNALWYAGCKSCHGTNLDGAGGTAVYSCRACHGVFSTPIPPPGHRVLLSLNGKSGRHNFNYEAGRSDFSYCSGAACHGVNNSTGGTAVTSLTGIAGHGRACKSSGCHAVDLTTHTLKPFQSDYFHGANYRTPSGSCADAQCHGAALTGGNSWAPSCHSCHDDQWSVFSTTHTKLISTRYHHNTVDADPSSKSTNTGWFIACQDCHGTSLSGTQGGAAANFAYRYSCKVCHTRFGSNTIPPPRHTAYKSEGSKSGWHYYNYSSTDPDGPNANCSGTACHGANGISSAAASGSFGRSPACGECH